jgi:hypothetical protein
MAAMAMAAAANASPSADQSRIRRKGERRTGAMRSQKPSAEEASTGPTRRATDTASAASAKYIPQGTSILPLRQAAVSQAAALAWLPMTTLVAIAPIMTTLRIAM